MMGKTPDQRRTGKRWRRQVVEFVEKAAFLPVAARREGRVAGDAERMMDGIFVGHHERTGAITVPFRAWITERHDEFSGKPQNPKMSRSSVDAY